MIEGQPADEHVRALDASRATHRSNVCQQLSVREHDALRVSGASRSVLQEGERIAARGCHLPDDALAALENLEEKRDHE